jgi:hypothetical protein
MRRETRPFVVEVRRGQQKKAPQPTILPAPLPEPQGDDVMMRRAEEALFGRPAQGPGAATGEPQAPARRERKLVANQLADILPEVLCSVADGSVLRATAETLLEFVRAKNVRFPSGRGVMPSWPPRP